MIDIDIDGIIRVLGENEATAIIVTLVLGWVAFCLWVLSGHKGDK